MRHEATLLATVARIMLAADCVLWATFAILLLTGTASVGDVDPTVITVMAVLMAGNALVLGVLAWQVLRGHAFVDYAAVIVLTVNAALSIADEVGAMDVAAFAFQLVVLVLLVLGIRGSRPERSAL